MICKHLKGRQNVAAISHLHSPRLSYFFKSLVDPDDRDGINSRVYKWFIVWKRLNKVVSDLCQYTQSAIVLWRVCPTSAIAIPPERSGKIFQFSRAFYSSSSAAIRLRGIASSSSMGSGIVTLYNSIAASTAGQQAAFTRIAAHGSAPVSFDGSTATSA
jgi:hypothetical protein